MKRKGSSGSGLFLIELMISIAFFAIASAGCVQIFAKAHRFSEEAEKLDRAVSLAQSLAEENSGAQEKESSVQYYDESHSDCEKKQAVYEANVQIDREEQMRKIKITVRDAKGNSAEPIYQLETSIYPGIS